MKGHPLAFSAFQEHYLYPQSKINWLFFQLLKRWPLFSANYLLCRFIFWRRLLYPLSTSYHGYTKSIV